MQSQEVQLRPGRTPIVVIGDDWGRHVSTSQHLFRRLLGRYPLVWVNSFGHRLPRLTLYDARRATRKLAAMLFNSAKVGSSGMPEPDCIINPRALPWHNIGPIRQLNGWSLARDIRRALHRIAPGEQPLFVTCTPAAYTLVGRLNEIASIYFCIDDYGEIVGTDKDLLDPLERLMLARVDALVATARSLLDTKRPTSGNSLYLPQGVNFDHFATPRALPPDLQDLPRPIIGFAGGVGPAIDFALIREVAAGLPAATVVLVGPHQQRIDEADWPSNVRFLGPRPYADLPAYVQGFDVALIPYVLNAWTRAVDPLKLLEYLAAGIPVVSTELPEVHKYSSVVRIATGSSTFVQAVRAAIDSRDEEARLKRQAVAMENRWEIRAAQFVDFAERVALSNAAESPETLR